jgi:protein-tyrosine phosphatase
MDQRIVSLGNLFNVRDLGGYTTADGRTVRWGQLYRAASLHQLDPEHEEEWERLALTTVVDLRRTRERIAGGWPEMLESATVCELPMLPDDWTLPRDGFESPTDHLSAAYGDMARLGRDAVRSTFELLSDPARYPLLFFCIAGKDRTGMVAAVLLSALGVDDEQVLEDYELSGEHVVALVEHLKSQGRLDDNPMINQPIEVLRAPRVALETALERMRAEHGSVLGYLEWCGVTPEVIAAVRAQLLQ